MDLLRSRELDSLPDNNTDPRLLPEWMRREENREEKLLYRLALRMAMDSLLNEEQRGILHMRFWRRMSMQEIGGELGICTSGATKRVAAALEVLRLHVGFCVEVCKAFRRYESSLDW